MAKSYHHGDLKQAMIHETLKMIAANEDHLVGFREIARRLNVSRSAPYRHFENVESLLATAASEGYLMFLAELQQVADHGQWTPRKRFLELGICYVNFAINNPAHYRLMFDQRFFASERHVEVRKLAKLAFNVLRSVIKLNLTDEIPSEDLTKLAQLAWSSVHGMAHLFIDGQWQSMPKKQDFIRASCQRLLALI